MKNECNVIPQIVTVIYSLLASCKMHGVNPYEYIRDVLVRVGSHPAKDVLALTPTEILRPPTIESSTPLIRAEGELTRL